MAENLPTVLKCLKTLFDILSSIAHNTLCINRIIVALLPLSVRLLILLTDVFKYAVLYWS